MRDRLKHFPVNWIDGMKINKKHFIDQDSAGTDALQDVASLCLSPYRYGILPSSIAKEDTFNVAITLDKSSSVIVSVFSCQAITSGGVRISFPSLISSELTKKILLSEFRSSSIWWVMLVVNPFEKQSAGSPDVSENPPRAPYVLPTYSIDVISKEDYSYRSNDPYALTIGKILFNSDDDIRIDEEYIPPCFSINSHQKLISFHGELFARLVDLETNCSKIIQNIFKRYKRAEQNNISELVMFVCDRMMICIGQLIGSMKLKPNIIYYEPPSKIFQNISSLARILRNTLELRVGSGQEILMNYLAQWSSKQGDLVDLVKNMADADFSNEDIKTSLQQTDDFMKKISSLFDILSKQELLDEFKPPRPGPYAGR